MGLSGSGALAVGVSPARMPFAADDLRRTPLATLQVNVGKRCNQACRHCHVEAGPHRSEAMEAATVTAVLAVLAGAEGVELDITGGAPELNSHFRQLVERGRALGREVRVRTNLTVLREPGYEAYPTWYAAQGVRLIASLPCYTRENVEAQRGAGVFDTSLAALRQLDAVGYGDATSGLELDLVYNPGGAFLPGPQAALEADYRAELGALGVRFNRLLTLANLPLGRFRADLESQGASALDDYLRLLRDAYNPATLPHLMCRTLVSVGWDGRLYDCDFNQMLEMELAANDTSPPGAPPGVPPGTASRSAPRTIFDLAAAENGGVQAALAGLPIAVAGHCYGCTAGAGSSCDGALVVG